MPPTHLMPPANAETCSLSQFVHVGRKPSIFVKDTMIDDPAKTYLSCPACKKHSKVPVHGQSINCDCGLKMQAAGNGLTIWK